MSLSQNYPTTRPTLTLDFAKAKRVDPRVTFTRASTATYFDASGTLRSAAANAPRIDFDPATLACRGLLVEEQRTNSIYPSNFSSIVAVVGNNAWYEVLTELDTTVNAATAPDGTTTAALLAVNTTATNRSIFYRSGVNTAATYAYSVFCKANSTDTKVRLFIAGEAALTNNVRADFTLSGSGTASAATATGTAVSVATPTIQPVGNGWYRCAIYVTLTAPINITVLIYPGDAAAQTTNSQTLVWGAQLEAGAFPTSYIPTTTTSLTRSADVASVTTLSPWFNASEGTLFAESAAIAFTARPATFNDGTQNNAIGLVQTATAIGQNTYVSNVFQGTSTVLGTYTTNTFYKQASAYKLNDAQDAANGTTNATDTTFGVPTVTQLLIGQGRAGVSLMSNSWIKRIAYYNTRLPNAQLQALTAP